MEEGCDECNQQKNDILNLHDMFRIVGDQLTERDILLLKFMYREILSDEILAQIKGGFSFFLALERIGRVDDSNFKHVLKLLRILGRQDLMQFVTLRRRKTVQPDPVDEYLQLCAKTSTVVPVSRKRKLDLSSTAQNSSSSSKNGDDSPQPSTSKFVTADESLSPSGLARRKLRKAVPTVKRKTLTKAQFDPDSDSVVSRERSLGGTETPIGLQRACGTPGCDGEKYEIRKKVTCDIRLRVRAEYCNHNGALEGNVHSNKPELLERQFETFMQANTILKSRDLGSIICDIKFSELTYLDAFWRDYINGSLLEALKGVFITESLKQAVGHEAIKLLVNVDEDDYEAGRLLLLKNLTE